MASRPLVMFFLGTKKNMTKELFLLLSNSALNLLANLSELKLGPQDLVLLLLKSTLSLLKGGLELHLLSLKALPDLVNLMDGATTLANLVHDVLDLIAEALVLTTNLIKLSNRLLISRLHTEELRGSIPAVPLGNIQIHAHGVNLLLPLIDNSVKVLGLLVHLIIQDLGLVQVVVHLFHLTGELGPCLLNLVELRVHVLNRALSLSEPGRQLHLGHLQVLSLGNSVILVLAPPLSGLALSLLDLTANLFP